MLLVLFGPTFDAVASAGAYKAHMVIKPGHRGRSSVLFFALLSVFALGISTAHAQGVGFHGGFAIDPEQAYVGSHYESKAIARNLHVRPSIDGAFGNDLTIASINVEFLYKFSINPSWAIYQGGGPSIHFIRFGDPAETDVTGGFSGIFGFAHESGFFAEMKAGSGQGHALKLGVGYTVKFK